MIVSLTLESGKSCQLDLNPLIEFLNRTEAEDPDEVTERFMAIMQVVHDVMRRSHPKDAQMLLKASLALLQGVEIAA